MRVAVIGAGFAGLVMARELAKLGFTVDLYEEHRRVGFPPHCTGLISWRTLEAIGSPAKDALEDRYEGFVFHTPSTSLPVRTEPFARVDRVRLEELLLEEAESEGARTFLGVKVARVAPAGGGVEVEAGGGERRVYDVAIIAEGLRGSLRGQLGVSYAPVTSLGVNVDYEGAIESGGGAHVHIHLSNSGEDLFYWAFTVASGYTVLGGLSRSPFLLSENLKGLKQRYGLRRERRRYGGQVIHGPPLSCPWIGKSVFIVGDAAGLNKPLTGGGLYPNSVLARTVSEMVRRGRPLAEALRLALSRVVGELRRQHRLASRLLYSPVLARLVDIAGSAGLEPGRVAPLDYDRHDRIVRSVVRAQPGRSVLFALKLLFKEPRLAARLLLGVLA